MSVKASAEQSYLWAHHEGMWGIGCIAVLILNLCC
jgi:hypothetical protein